jgi:hypothetical protein
MSHGKYERLYEYLDDAAQRCEESIQVEFSELDALVGGELPASARDHREWWANGGHSHARAWMDAGYQVASVMSGGVRFERNTKGPAAKLPRLATGEREPRLVSETAVSPVVDQTDVRITLDWHDAGSISLDQSGGIAFPKLPPQAGLYRMTFATPGRNTVRIYIGETDDLRRRAGGYRNAHEGQQTNVRIKGLLGTLLSEGGTARLSIAVAAHVHDGKGVTSSLDFSRKAARVLAESAALVAAQLAGDVEIENLG